MPTITGGSYEPFIDKEFRMNYFMHWKLNMIVSIRCLVLSLFHCVHAFFPFEVTSHEKWGYFNREH